MISRWYAAIILISVLVPLSAPAQSVPPSSTPVITLGTVAGPPPRPNRAQSSNLLIVDGRRYVIDAGDGVTRRITQAGFNVRDVGTRIIKTTIRLG